MNLGLAAFLAGVVGLGLPAAAQVAPGAIESGVVEGGASRAGAWRVIDLAHGALVQQFGPGRAGSIAVPLPEGEGAFILELQSFEVFTPEARVVVDGMNGERELARPDVLLLRGQALGIAGSRAFIGSSATGVHGFVEAGGRTWVISSGSFDGANAGPVVIAAMEGDLAAALAAAGFECQVLIPPDMPPNWEPVPAGMVGVDYTCRLAQVAIETDWEFTGGLFGGSVLASGNYAAVLVAAVGEVYRRDLNLGLQINYLRLWDDPNDPWTGGDTSAQLTQFRSHWQSNMGAVSRDVAHMFSGRGLGGGVAWLNAVCGSFAYAVSANLGGTFPYPLQNNHGGNWDLMVVAHEWGHNFGAQHTHDLVPAPDLCGAGNCAGANMGTIMSYCHTCSGGMGNIRLEFHPQSLAQMDGVLGAAGCVSVPAGTIATGEAVSTIAGVPIDIDVLANDIPVNCDGAVIFGFQGTTPLGGTVEQLVGAGPGGRDLLRYTPPVLLPSGQDSVSYTVQSGVRAPAPATALVTLQSLREPDPVASTLAGVGVDYYALGAPLAVLPNFAGLTPASSAVVSTINVPSTGGNFAGSGLADWVGAVYEGYLIVPGDGLWTLYIESDDGSRVLIGEDVVVGNDGLHGMLERSGQAALKAGAHALRVEFFENEGGAGLIFRIAGPGLNKQVTPGSMLVRANPCRPDLTGTATPGQPGYGFPDGTLTSDDFFYYLAQYAAGNLAIADLTGTAVPGSPGYGEPNGILNNDDFFYYLAIFAAGC